MKEVIIKYLEKLGFSKNTDEIYLKTYPYHNNYEVKVNIKEGKIHYRNDDKTTIERVKDNQIQLGDKTSSHFNPKQEVNSQESFVVLEAVNALLVKGYEPQDLHIERRWKVGHGASGGKADINIYKNDKTFIIVECKTADSEFEKEKKKMLSHGGQLFTYLNEDANTEYLVLYTSSYDEEENEIIRENLIVKIQDNKQKVEECKGQDKKAICSYSKAKNKDEFFNIWKNLYNNYFYRYGIFEDDVNAYSVELKPLKKKDLISLNTSKGLFNKFAEILRHNNISDNANAFNKMLSLILCKIVDEEEKRDNDVLDFQIIEGLSDEKLIDKFQRLYKQGMELYLGINDFVYHSDEEIESRIKDFPKRTPLEEILQFFKDIKYYTDKTFAFKEIYNKKLFEENAEILKEVVELLQLYQFKNVKKNQILGDFFELLLNHGVKQSEGQFFTPLPIAKFMVLGLDFDNLQKEKAELNPNFPLLKTLDYACGAGHFLIEAIDKIEKINQQNKLGFDVDIWTKEYIFGIEKDYRLARTSKIACFLNGDGEANVIYGDGLKKHPQLDEDYQKFDVILTNPPYSVRQFKNYVELNPNDFELFNEISEKASEIEVLFIERAKQALRYGGRIAIILPSSILSNAGIYTKARELFLKYFEVKAITELGSKTFIATGTNTVILFLQRRDNKYPIDYQRVANELFDEYKFYKNDYIKSKSLLEAFISYRELSDYHQFLKDNVVTENLSKTEIFETYKDWFYNSTQVKNIKKKKFFKDKTDKEQSDYLFDLYVKRIKQIEKEKFYYFLLTHGQKTVVVKSPTGTAEQKEFLGYEFNKKRGFEGIEVYTDSNGKPTTKLFDDEQDNPTKADYYIRRAFGNEELIIDEQAQTFVKQVHLTDMLDFEKIDFEKIINTNAEQKIKITSKWPLVKISNTTDKIIGETTKVSENKWLDVGKIPVISQETENLISGYVSSRYKPIKDFPLVVFGDHTSVFKFVDFEFVRGADGVVLMKPNDSFLPKYYFFVLRMMRNFIPDVNKYKRHYTLLKNLKIPLPPKEIQQKIVSEIERLEKKEEKNIQTITQKEFEIKKIIDDVFNKNFDKKKLGEIATIQSGGTPKTKEKEYWENGTINWATLVDVKEKYLFETKRKITQKGLENSSAKLLPINSVLFSSRATIGVVSIAKVETTTNQGFKNFICNPQIIHYEFLYHILIHESKNIEKLGSGTTFLEVSATKIANYSIPIPPISEQKKIVAQITKIETTISKLKEEIVKLKEEKTKVLDKYLK